MNDGKYFGLTATQLNLAFFAVVAALAVGGVFAAGGPGRVVDEARVALHDDLGITLPGGDNSTPSHTYTAPARTTAPSAGSQADNAYPPSVVQNFMDACMFEGSGQGYCSCALDEIQARYSLEEYITLETRMLNTGQFPEELAGVIAKCIQ